MKTLFFCNLIPLKNGAFEALLAALGHAFARAGDEFVAVFAGEPIASVAESLRAAGVRWHVLKGWADGPDRERAWHFVLPAVALVRRECPDVAVVNFGNEMPTLAAILLARAWRGSRTRWVWQQHQQIQDPGPVGRYLSRVRLLAVGVVHFVAVYEGGRLSLRRRGIPDARITVISNSVAAFKPQRARGWLRHELDLPRDAVVFVSTGSLIPRKRIEFIVRACASLRGADDVQWRLLVIGDGPERQALNRLGHSLGISQDVHFMGIRQDVREILAEADVLVHASLAETCTYAITESMAAGIPAVVTDAGAAREQIEDGRSGFVVGKDDLESFVSRLGRLLGDPALRQSMGAVARERWARHFCLAGSGERYQRLYNDLALGRTGIHEGISDTNGRPPDYP